MTRVYINFDENGTAVQDGAKPVVVQDRSRTLRAVLRALADAYLPCDCDDGFQCSACALRDDLREVITMLEDD